MWMRVLGQRAAQRLHVGVDREEIDAGKTGGDHAIDGVAAASADADHLDRCGVFGLGYGASYVSHLLRVPS